MASYIVTWVDSILGPKGRGGFLLCDEICVLRENSLGFRTDVRAREINGELFGCILCTGCRTFNIEIMTIIARAVE